MKITFDTLTDLKDYLKHDQFIKIDNKLKSEYTNL